MKYNAANSNIIELSKEVIHMFDFVGFKKYLEENGYKQKFVAQKANINETAFSAIATGKIKCSLENYIAICQALSVPLGKFISNTNQAAVS